MLEGLQNELARMIAVYRNRSNVFRWNGQASSFSLRDVIRHFLFARAEQAGLTPIPNVRLLHWTLDLVCVRSVRVEKIFLIRQGRKEDYRQLLLFPRSVEKVLIALDKAAVPEEHENLVIIQVPKRPTTAINRALSAKQVVDIYKKAFYEVYGVNPPWGLNQMIGPASRLASHWMSAAKDLNMQEYFVWFFNLRSSKSGGEERVVSIQELMNRQEITNFRLSKKEKKSKYDDWKTGWTV